MSVRFKIIGGFLIVFIIGLILGITGLICSSRLTKMSDEQYILSEKSSGVSSVLNAHYTWKQALTESVLFMQPFSGSQDPATCALGKWKATDAASGITDEKLLSLLREIDAPHDYIHRESSIVVGFIESGNREGAERELNDYILPKANDTIKILGEMQARYAQLLAEKGEAIVKLGNTMTVVIIIAMALALIISVLLAWKIISSIMKPLRNIAHAAETIAIGDLNVELNHSANDEIGMLVDAFQKIVKATRIQISATEALANGDLTTSVTPRSEKDAMNIALKAMLDNLNDMFGGLSASADQVATGSRHISDGAQALAQGSTQQAAAVQQLSASIAEISEKTDNNASMARRAAELAEIIKRSAEKGSTQMDEMMSAVRDINQASQSINKVIKVIDDIAFQTNILALNAAVEAARAGQHGKGFAVVAEEVRNLAAKSAEAAKDTESLIANSMEKAAFGSQIAEETAISLTEIVSGINESSVLVGDIAKSSDEQSAGISQINHGIDQVAQVVQQNSATAEQSAAASEEMSGQSAMLENMISKFKIRGTPSGQSARLTAPSGAPRHIAIPDRTDDSSFGKY